MLEAEVEAYLIERVKDLGGEIRKCRWIGRKNCPDRRVMLHSDARVCLDCCCWVELKAPGEKPTEAQYREHARMRRLGEKVYVIDSFEKVDHLMAHGYV